MYGLLISQPSFENLIAMESKLLDISNNRLELVLFIEPGVDIGRLYWYRMQFETLHERANAILRIVHENLLSPNNMYEFDNNLRCTEEPEVISNNSLIVISGLLSQMREDPIVRVEHETKKYKERQK